MRILLIDDEEAEYILLQDMVSKTPTGEVLLGYDLDWVSTYEQALAAFSDAAYDVYLVDNQLGPRTGLELLHDPLVQQCQAPVILLTGHDDYAIDMAAMQSGASDYLVKGQLTLSSLEHSIRYAIGRKQVQHDLQQLAQERGRALALLEKQAQQLNALQKATSSLLSTLELPVLMGQILDAAQEAIPAAEYARLGILEQPGNKSDLLGDNDTIDARIRHLPLFDPDVAELRALLDGRTRLIENPQEEPLLLATLENEEDRRAVRSAAIAPLVIGGQVFGALFLASSWPSAFDEATQNLLASLAATATAAIHNAILYSEIRNLARTDPLTGQFNRRTFFEVGQRELERSKRFGRLLSGIMLDVDRFKPVNDTYGHLAGDQVLIGIVERCCSVIRRVDILGRYGGDEFAILLPETDERLAKEIAERIRSVVFESPIATDAGPVTVSVSMGIAQSNVETTELETLLNRADKALYQSKQDGRNKITVFT